MSQRRLDDPEWSDQTALTEHEASPSAGWKEVADEMETDPGRGTE